MATMKKVVTKTPEKKKTTVKKTDMPAVKSKKMSVNNDKENVDSLFKEAVARSESLDFAGTIQLLKTILKIAPDNMNVLNYMGMMLVGMDEHAEAIKYFDRVIKMNPGDKEALNNKAIALHYLDRDIEALKCVDSSIALDKRYPDAYINKAVILHSMGKVEESKAILAKGRALEAVLS
ncbi:MAG TPA: tetratricopeptide repeat protein [Methanocellaceae archaeon]|jgi:tetratricopeptide (TPR) repeat protein